MFQGQCKNKLSLKKILIDFNKAFPMVNINDLINDLDEPLDCDSLQEMIDVIAKIRNKIQNKLDAIYSKTGLGSRSVEKFMNDAQNFSALERQSLENLQQNIDDYIGEFYVVSQSVGIYDIVKSERKYYARDKKKKTIRSHKKNKLRRLNSNDKKWISTK